MWPVATRTPDLYRVKEVGQTEYPDTLWLRRGSLGPWSPLESNSPPSSEAMIRTSTARAGDGVLKCRGQLFPISHLEGVRIAPPFARGRALRP